MGIVMAMTNAATSAETTTLYRMYDAGRQAGRDSEATAQLATDRATGGTEMIDREDVRDQIAVLPVQARPDGTYLIDGNPAPAGLNAVIDGLIGDGQAVLGAPNPDGLRWVSLTDAGADAAGLIGPNGDHRLNTLHALYGTRR